MISRLLRNRSRQGGGRDGEAGQGRGQPAAATNPALAPAATVSAQIAANGCRI